ncbi:saccharopine dehydrogenase family protein [Vallicoccus soli]|uniref:Saccharopine dehydrogenase n=1 Tax=Vallicoccus soli TaxID=2339232 RepID=A0A3A3YZP0_9ACTN|nr:saccharopine dehydrogenase NADP-binding domain-containing protein [Vallicoccus soli]RJK96291.1 saccharopine dehydrogenase [Vallicoccus soli]
MTGRIVLFGATGFTGGLVAAALAPLRGDAPLVLAGRDRARLEALASRLGGSAVEVAVADATDEAQVAGLVGRDDVLVSTVGPFARLGRPAVAAATGAGAAYLDSTGEPAFLEEVFRRHGPRAAATGARLLPAFGYDYVPGNLAAALALREAGGEARRVDVGYFLRGRGGLSTGTLASAAGAALQPGLAWRTGALRHERPAARVRSFHLGGRERAAVSVAGSEHLVLPRSFPQLLEVDVLLGWAGDLARPLQGASALAGLAGRVPGVRAGAGALAGRLAGALPGGTGQGPSPQARARTRSVAVAEAFTVDDRLLARVVLQGPDPYGLTGALLARGALAAAQGRLRGAGALGPVDALGLDGLGALARDAGLVPLEEG